ncbi:MAG: hypothetical protein A2176_13165 [Spirochaetes bacterium RBG_13_51_14]|nr:MAG: hypothetical protein A2176_13165 [Spirochaetes bacterium RBG_13_51_14]
MFLLFRHFKINELLRTALNWINGIGIGGMAVYAIFYIAATVLFIPGSILTLGGGFLYGVVWGTALVSVSSVTGASLAFLIGRYLARGWINKKIEKSENFRAIDEAVGREGWKIVLLCRLSPAFPYNMLNYAFGLTRIRFWHYLLASWIGMLPVTVMYVYLGSLASDISTLGSGGRVRTPAEWGLYLVGFLAAVGVTVFVTRLARKALRKTIGDELTSVDK